ncbi:transcriptional regulator [candidate division WOR-3 bacterium]|nr:transcriptional regulator [candidate division WOR-3 bacterium]MCK4576387.1 transcriptional regulator [candidate division WOR-3 bacterium]
MIDFNPSEVNRLIHSPIRLGIMTILNYLVEASFNYLKKKLNVTDGNLSSHLVKLEEAGYIDIKKKFIDKKPHTSYQITRKGEKALRKYIEQLEGIIKGGAKHEDL